MAERYTRGAERISTLGDGCTLRTLADYERRIARWWLRASVTDEPGIVSVRVWLRWWPLALTPRWVRRLITSELAVGIADDRPVGIRVQFAWREVPHD